METPLEVDVATAAQMLREGALLVDVREAAELAICRVPAARHIPLRQISELAADLPQDRPLLILCHAGVRSRSVTQFLRSQGRTDVSNVAGGIDAWAEILDPSMDRY